MSAIRRIMALPFQTVVLAALCMAVPRTASAVPSSIRVVMDNNYPPYVFYDDTGRLQGILIDQWLLWEEKTGIRAEIHAMDWDNALRAMKNGEFDVIDTAFQTPEREKWLDFSKSYADIAVPIFFDKNISGITDAASLKGFPVAVKSGDAAVERLHQNGIENLMLFNSYEAVLIAAREHKVSVFVADAPPSLYFLYKFGIQDHFRKSAPLNIGQFHRAVGKGNRKLLALVESGFDRIPATAYREIETQWYGTSLNLIRLPQYISVVAAGLSLLILILFAWNSTLRKTVARRTEAMNTSLKEYQSLSARQDAILSSIPDIIMEVDPNKVYTWANRAGLEFFGEDAIGREAADYFEGDQNTYNSVQTLLDGTENIIYVESFQRRRDGRIRLLGWWCGKLKDEQGRIIGAISTARDITEKNRTEADLKSSLSLLNAALESTADGLLIVDTCGKIMRYNRKFATMWKIPANILAENNDEVLLNHVAGQLADPERFSAKVGELNAHPEISSFDQLLFADGRVFERYSLPQKIGDRVVGRVWSFRDITEKTRIAKELHHMTETLEQRVEHEVRKNMEQERLLIRQSRLAAMGEMIGNIAHQWRQPLNALGILLFNIKEACEFQAMDAAFMNQAVTDGNRLIRKMSTTISDFSNFFRPDKEIVAFSALEQVHEAVKLVASSFQNDHLDISIDAPADLKLLGFPNEFSQVLLNLLSNARDAVFTRRAPEPGKVEILFSEQNGRGCVHVRDTGGGIPEDILDRIFDPYFTTKEKGSGIGLYMSKMIIENNMNGRVTARNISGGAEFTVSVPLAAGVA